jgi:hypothetical protein
MLLQPHDPPHIVIRDDEVYLDVPTWGKVKRET